MTGSVAARSARRVRRWRPAEPDRPGAAWNELIAVDFCLRASLQGGEVWRNPVRCARYAQGCARRVQSVAGLRGQSVRCAHRTGRRRGLRRCARYAERCAENARDPPQEGLGVGEDALGRLEVAARGRPNRWSPNPTARPTHRRHRAAAVRRRSARCRKVKSPDEFLPKLFTDAYYESQISRSFGQ